MTDSNTPIRLLWIKLDRKCPSLVYGSSYEIQKFSHNNSLSSTFTMSTVDALGTEVDFEIDYLTWLNLTGVKEFCFVNCLKEDSPFFLIGIMEDREEGECLPIEACEPIVMVQTGSGRIDQIN
jgi:hypothetical protein